MGSGVLVLDGVGEVTYFSNTGDNRMVRVRRGAPPVDYAQRAGTQMGYLGTDMIFSWGVAVGDYNGHVGLGWKCAAEVATAIRGAIISAKLNIVPLRRGYWGSNEGKPHTVPTKISAKCGSVRVRLIPAPRGTGLVAAPVAKKLLMMAGLRDVYSSSSGHTRSLGNFSKAVTAQGYGDPVGSLLDLVPVLAGYVSEQGTLRADRVSPRVIGLDVSANPLLASMLLDPEPIVETVTVTRKTPWFVWAGVASLAAGGAGTAAYLLTRGSNPGDDPQTVTGVIVVGPMP